MDDGFWHIAIMDVYRHRCGYRLTNYRDQFLLASIAAHLRNRHLSVPGLAGKKW